MSKSVLRKAARCMAALIAMVAMVTGTAFADVAALPFDEGWTGWPAFLLIGGAVLLTIVLVIIIKRMKK